MSLGSYVVRPGCLKRHLLLCPDGQGITPLEEGVDAWMKENITLARWCETAHGCKNCFEAVILHCVLSDDLSTILSRVCQ